MGDLTTYGASQSMQNAVSGNRYVSLHSGDPGITGASSELSTANGYARKLMAVTVTAGGADNDSDIVFAAPTADYGNVTHFVVWDAVTGGNAWFRKALTQSKNWPNGVPLTIPADELDLLFS